MAEAGADESSWRQFPKTKDDWTWLYPEVPKVLRQLVEDGCALGYERTVRDDVLTAALAASRSSSSRTKQVRNAFRYSARCTKSDEKIPGAPGQQKKFIDKMPEIALNLKVPFHAFAAFERDEYRKPATGMWDSYVADFNEGVPVGARFLLHRNSGRSADPSHEADLTQSFYVGDAAGRPRTATSDPDHSDCDSSARPSFQAAAER